MRLARETIATLQAAANEAAVARAEATARDANVQALLVAALVGVGASPRDSVCLRCGEVTAVEVERCGACHAEVVS